MASDKRYISHMLNTGTYVITTIVALVAVILALPPVRLAAS